MLKKFAAVTLFIALGLAPVNATPANRAAMIAEINARLPSGTMGLTAANLRLVFTDLLSGITAFVADNPVIFPLPVRLSGSSSGTVTIQAQAATGTPTLTLPNTTGTFAVTASSPLVLNATTGNLTCSTCSATTGTVTSVATGTGLSGGPVTTTGTISLANTTVTPSTYGDATHVASLTVDAQGRLTAASNVSITAGGTVTSVTPGTGLTSTPNPIVATGTMSLANTAVTPASYGDSTHVPAFTVDAQGRLTAATNIAIAVGTVTSVATGAGLTGGPITTTGTAAVDVANSAAIDAGTVNKIVDAAGLQSSQTPQTVALSGSSFSPDLHSGTNMELTMVHASCTCTINSPANVFAGAEINMALTQSPTGTDLVSWGPNFKFPSGTPPTLSTAGNAVDIATFYCRTTTFCALKSFAKGLQ